LRYKVLPWAIEHHAALAAPSLLWCFKNSDVNALVFGISGQGGFYLGNLLGRQGIKVVGISRSDGGCRWIVADVAKAEQVEALVRKHQPDYIFHLAANSTTRYDALFENHEAERLLGCRNRCSLFSHCSSSLKQASYDEFL